MSKVMLLGDTHGNTKFITNYVLPEAKRQGVKWIYQVGDFGYWEHTDEGRVFLDEVNEALVHNGLNLVFIQGNHDKVSLIDKNYPEIEGFHVVRSAIWFAKNGTQWQFEGTSFLALGGAYSIDKSYRLKAERAKAQNIFDSYASDEKYAGFADWNKWRHANKAAEGSFWFPEEEMTDVELDNILRNVTTKVDVILAHDKPSSSNPMMKLLPINECMPNQRRLQLAVNHYKPALFVHGHLHVRYTDTIRCEGSDRYTRVEGLGADVPNFNQLDSDWNPRDAWEILDL